MTAPTCAVCGQTHLTWRGNPACTAHVKTEDNRPCGNPPIPGLSVCGYHGGNARHAKAAAKRNVEEKIATVAVRTLGLPIDITPTDALLQEVQWTAGHVKWLRSKVQELEDEDLVWGVTRTKVGGEDRGETSEAKPSIWFALYESERKHLVSVCSAALRAGVEERKVRLAESQGDLVVAVIRRILDGLLTALLAAGIAETLLTDAWQAAVADVVPRELRAIAGGA